MGSRAGQVNLDQLFGCKVKLGLCLMLIHWHAIKNAANMFVQKVSIFMVLPSRWVRDQP